MMCTFCETHEQIPGRELCDICQNAFDMSELNRCETCNEWRLDEINCLPDIEEVPCKCPYIEMDWTETNLPYWLNPAYEPSQRFERTD